MRKGLQGSHGVTLEMAISPFPEKNQHIETFFLGDVKENFCVIPVVLNCHILFSFLIFALLLLQCKIHALGLHLHRKTLT